MSDKKNMSQEAENKRFNEAGENLRDEGGRTDGARMSDGENPAGDISSEGADTAQAGEEWKDQYLRLSAEFDNFRKRTLREKMELIAAGGKDVISDLLPVLDDIDRAQEAAANVTDIESVRKGTELIAHKLYGVLQAKGMKEIEALGQKLDTDFHEAVARTPVQDESQKGKIVDVIQKGYMLKDNVIRHAKVVVGE